MQKFSSLKYCAISSNVIVQNTTSGKVAQSGRGSSPDYLGTMVGQTHNTGTTYQSDNKGEISQTETVYYVVNNFNAGISSYWSNTNVNAPKLTWENKN